MLLDRYTIDTLLGEGSFGRVFKVIDNQDEKRPLVVKIQFESMTNEI